MSIARPIDSQSSIVHGSKACEASVQCEYDTHSFDELRLTMCHLKQRCNASVKCAMLTKF